MFRTFLKILIAFTLVSYGFGPAASATVKIKDIVDVEGVRGNDLVGYGLVIGLDGSGDTIRNSPYTEEALSNLLERLGVNIQGSDFRPNNVAAVVVTAALPAFARSGSRIDINVSSIGDAKSLAGGTLIMTPLNAADGEVYAVAQGSVLISGFQAEGDGASITEGVPTSGTIPNGARIEKEVNFDFSTMSRIRLALRSPDFTTAERIEAEINTKFSSPIATLLDSGTVELDLTATGQSPARIISQIENYDLIPAQKARVVIDQRSGTIVLGQNVKVSPVAVTHGSLTVTVAESLAVSQPNAFGDGDTAVVPQSEIDIQEEGSRMFRFDSGTQLDDIVRAVNQVGAAPGDLMAILEAMKQAGALRAELVVI